MTKCKYPNEACANMKFFHGNTYCDSVPCVLKEELPKPSNADKIRAMSDEELAEFLEQFEVCSHCEYSDKERCTFENPCVHAFATAIALKWLKSEAE